jgi:hypothetical protein
LRKDGFKAIHRFGIAVLREQQIADGKVGRNGVGLRCEGASEALAGFLSLVKVKQSVAKKHESRRVVGVLLGVRTQNRSGFDGPVLRAETLGTSKNWVGVIVHLSASHSLPSDEDQQKSNMAKTRTGHGIQL